jgi:hypothetical protein
MCRRIREGKTPWRQIGEATLYCTAFPVREFERRRSTADFDVRWPLTFAAWFWGASGAAVDRECAAFLVDSGFREQASAALAEYEGGEWLGEWRSQFEEALRTVSPRT